MQVKSPMTPMSAGDFARIVAMWEAMEEQKRAELERKKEKKEDRINGYFSQILSTMLNNIDWDSAVKGIYGKLKEMIVGNKKGSVSYRTDPFSGKVTKDKYGKAPEAVGFEINRTDKPSKKSDIIEKIFKMVKSSSPSKTRGNIQYSDSANQTKEPTAGNMKLDPNTEKMFNKNVREGAADLAKFLTEKEWKDQPVYKKLWNTLTGNFDEGMNSHYKDPLINYGKTNKGTISEQGKIKPLTSPNDIWHGNSGSGPTFYGGSQDNGMKYGFGQGDTIKDIQAIMLADALGNGGKGSFSVSGGSGKSENPFQGKEKYMEDMQKGESGGPFSKDETDKILKMGWW